MARFILIEDHKIPYLLIDDHRNHSSIIPLLQPHPAPTTMTMSPTTTETKKLQRPQQQLQQHKDNDTSSNKNRKEQPQPHNHKDNQDNEETMKTFEGRSFAALVLLKSSIVGTQHLAEAGNKLNSHRHTDINTAPTETSTTKSFGFSQFQSGWVK